MQSTLEYERKLEAEPGWELPDLGGEPLEPRVFTSVYHDTPDTSLARAGITLRRRTERGKSVWQLKLPVGDARLELEEPGGPAALPDPIAKLLGTYIRRGRLAPVAELRTRRHGVLVTRKDTHAEATIDEVSVMDAHRVAQEFVEIEVELKDGSPQRVDAIAAELCKAGARRSDEVPKLFRVLGIGREKLPDDPFERLRAMLRGQLREILANDPGTRLGADPESLHDMRVAVRRSRALLRAGSKLIANDVQTVSLELKWLGGLLGNVRDLDVLIEELRAQADELDRTDAAAARRLIRKLEQRRVRARRAMLKALDGDRYTRLLQRFDEEIDALQPSEIDTSLAEIAEAAVKKVRSTADEAGDDPPDELLHKIRKRGKRARYAGELAGMKKLVKSAKRLQDVLGEHQDAVVAEETLRSLAAGAPAEQALAAGRLIDAERARRAKSRKDWRKLLRGL